MFGCRKIFSGKYIFSGNANFRKRKIFLCAWLHFKKFFRKYFLVFGKEKGKHKPSKIPSTIAISPARSRDQRRELATARDRDRFEIASSRRREIAIDLRSRARASDRDRRRDLAPSGDRDLDLFRSVLLCVDRTSLVRGSEI